MPRQPERTPRNELRRNLGYVDKPRRAPIKPGNNDPRPADAPQRVQRLIATAGFCSRREAEELIEQGRVTVNEEVVELGATARMVDRIAVNGVVLEFPKPLYYVLNKPAGVITAMRDRNARTVMDFIPEDERIYPVGRLDKDTTGILFLTNDGAFAERVAHPRYEIEKSYVATLDRAFERKDAAKLERGIILKEGIATAKVRVLSPRRVEVTLHQGYNHIVKRLLGAIGYNVRGLERTRIGPIRISMPEGAYRRLTDAEVAAVLAATRRTIRNVRVTRDEVEAARRRRKEVREAQAPKKTTWEPRRPTKGGQYTERERVQRVSRDERAAIRDARRERGEREAQKRQANVSSSAKSSPRTYRVSSKRPSFSRKNRK